MKKTLLILLIGFLGQIIFAQDFNTDKLNAYFDTLEAHNKFMGSVAVSKNEEIIYQRSVGYSDVGNNIKANEKSKYRIGSISKTFTSVIVLKAVEEKKLELDQTIEEFFPSVPNADIITIKYLLTHRSGIHNFTNDANYPTWDTQAKTEKEMVEIIAKAGSDFTPGSKSEYSNSNFVLLTYILEKTYKKTYAELLTKYITKPLGLDNTFLGGKINPDNNECYSYRFVAKWKLEKETDMTIPVGAGAIVSTPGDIVKFSDALFGGKLLKNESLELMKTIDGNYGIGLMQFPFYNKTCFGHTGGIDGFSSIFVHFIDENISYALTSNGVNINTNDISIAVLSTIFNLPFNIPEFSIYKVESEDLDKYLGVYKSEQIELIITISKENNILIAQATGQGPVTLDATDVNKFTSDALRLELEFNPEENSMLLKQAGAEFTFTKK